MATPTAIEKRNLAAEIENAFQSRGLDGSPVNRKFLDAFLVQGFPGGKTEEYKFTPITRVLEKSFPSALPLPTTTSAAVRLIPELKCNLIVFINGVYSDEHSTVIDKDVIVKKTTATDADDTDRFSLLNGAFAKEEIEISVGPGKMVSNPIAIVYHFDSAEFTFANPRWRVMTGDSSQVSVVEYTSAMQAGPYFNNKHSFISVGRNAGVEYVNIQREPGDILVNNCTVQLAASSRAGCYTFTFDGQLVRNNLTLSIDGQGVDAHLYGLYLLSKNTIADNHTVVDHRKPNSSSNELYKGVMEGSSKGIFNGKIYVRPDAQKTNAFQSNRNLLLSEGATVNTKPQLEIWADDVKCSHGCTTGQLDEEALFYLRSRGIPKDLAKGMMLSAFATETLSSMKQPVVQNFVSEIIAGKLQHGS
ncbi:MAG TPA: Fe-S cluster assembly protein SufD [Cyclobacteriaceae bacterium]|nr:Fe-S cluster assembly protein SufD [Cyclobacteriaceae bacterium]